MNVGLHFLVLSLLVAVTLVDGFSPPVSKNFFLQYPKRFNTNRKKGPQAIEQNSKLSRMYEAVPPRMRMMNGEPGSAIDVLQREHSMEKWYVAPPGGYQGPAADSATVDRVPVGPPGSDAAVLSGKLSYGPPGTDGFVAGPPAHRHKHK